MVGKDDEFEREGYKDDEEGMGDYDKYEGDVYEDDEDDKDNEDDGRVRQVLRR